MLKWCVYVISFYQVFVLAVLIITHVCPRDKTKMAESKMIKLSTGIVRHDTSPANEY